MLYEQIESNKRDTVIFVLAFFLLVQICGAVIGQLLFYNPYYGLKMSTTVLMIYMFITILNAKSIIMTMNHGVKANREDFQILYNIVEEVCLSAGLRTMPELYVIREDSPNAFATGFSPEKSAIGVTTALLEKLNREELEAVIAHEVSHIMNYDIRLSTVSIALMSAVIFLCDMALRTKSDKDTPPIVVIFSLLFTLVAPIIAYAIHFAISRNREYLADATAVKYTRNPQALISALTKIDNDPDIVDNISSSCASMYIADPLKKRFDENGVKRKSKADLFSTHPTIEDRIEKLRRM